ncbi:NADPH-dependent FMN reductase [Croceicoccus bisphenolivorans]|uniref:NADPH-dependent FMN reductase n=1 Tax=Croceicoccus bisphenolivorans TaxID=1783232 RepID=UPI000832BD08|nr:NADPH-dependent FMN reductase [Croceicoccus bisphenolivorans]
MSDLPALDTSLLPPPSGADGEKVRLLLLYGSNRGVSLSRRLLEEAARLIEHLGGEARIFDPSALPLPETAAPDHAEVAKLHELLAWADGHMWCSPEYFGTMSSIMKAQLDWMFPVIAGKKLMAAKPVAIAQVCGAASTYNTTMDLAKVGKWLGMVVTPAMLTIAKVQEEFDADGRMKPSPYFNGLVDMAEELMAFAALLKPQREALQNRYSERASAKG